MLEAGKVTFPKVIPEPLKTTIEDWFGPREVVDEDMFNTYFNRVLNRDYPAFNELLNVQPGYAEIDWTVVNYAETELNHAGRLNTTSGVTSNSWNDGSNTKTGSISNHATGSQGNTSNTSGSSDHNGSSVNESDGKNQNNNSKTSQASESENGNEQYTADSEKNFDKTEYHKANANLDYHDPSKLTETDESVNRQGYRDSVQTMKRQGSVTNNSTMNKTLPMTISFSNSGDKIEGPTANIMETDKPASSGADGGTDVPGFSWNGASDVHQDVSRVVPVGNHPDQQITKRTYDDVKEGGKGNTNTKTYTGSTIDKHSNVDGKFYNDNGVLTELSGGSYDKTTHGASTEKNVARSHADINEEHGEDNGSQQQNAKNSESSLDTSVQHQENNGSSINDSEQVFNAVKDVNAAHSANETNSTGINNDEHTDHTITTGRMGGKSLAEIFDEATRYIETSSAWIWLEGRLEICFMQVL